MRAIGAAVRARRPRPATRRTARCSSYGAVRHVALEVREQTADADVHVVRLRKDVRVAVEPAGTRRPPTARPGASARSVSIGVSSIMSMASCVRRPARDSRRAACATTLCTPSAATTRRRAQAVAVARLQRHAVGVGLRACVISNSLAQPAPARRAPRERARGRTRRAGRGARTARASRRGRAPRRPAPRGAAVAMRARSMPAIASASHGKPAQGARADAAAARLVARKRGAVDEQRVEARRRERARGHRAGRTGAGDDRRHASWRDGDHVMRVHRCSGIQSQCNASADTDSAACPA